MDDRIKGEQYQDNVERLGQNDEETVEFESEMPQLQGDDVEFTPDERLEEEVSEGVEEI